MISKQIAEKEDVCCLCERKIPEGVVILRKAENNAVLCLLCLVEIAEMSRNERK